ncbi:IclR family transcriptional regulator C-terminal domain-containing protein [Ornithinimicrobium humiphilum]|uniref:IclR family transcriptional regulator n=1 Tax=Ornithinimicrobium humiphilum TaxID=125288 RepID=A0A543K7I3_9MICO|nr:IclR family transcriptional regulator C-terminal domain-containing protein [Ornithinimicrobium humiphilum]TQM91046.1 IclR family transcriptional regulator [Ornithinimicrobium humiphilum]
MPGGPTLIGSVVRALSLLEAVAEHGRPVQAKALARLTDIPLPTTYHLLRTLVHEGYLVRTAEGYVVGDLPAHLASAGEEGSGALRARRVLRTLHEDLRAATYLAVLSDGEIELADIVDSPAAPRTDLWVGLHDAAHATALGKAIIGALPDDSRRDYLARHPMVDLTPRTHTDVRALLAELEDDPGVVVDSQEYALGTGCVAVPFQGPGVLGAVAVSVPAERLPKVLGEVHRLTRAASRVALAWAGPARAEDLAEA